MLTVNDDVSYVESELADEGFSCPKCQGVLRPWGWARKRLIRHGIGRDLVSHQPRRSRCGTCSATHVLLDSRLAARRADSAAVIAAAIEAKAVEGAGFRPTAALLDRPVSTVRGWLRAFAGSAGAVREAFTTLIHRDGPDSAALWPSAQASPVAGALSMVAAYAQVLADRFGIVGMPWETAGLAAAGPWFFSPVLWASQFQHELALTRSAGPGKAGVSTG